jgi:hypothetical protein
MEVMSIFARVWLRSLHRSILILLGLSLFTGCLQLDRRDVLPATVLGVGSLPIWHVSSLRLVQDDGGSILIHSDRRSESLLQGLDPLLVHPAVRPFLFPSCDVALLP